MRHDLGHKALSGRGSQGPDLSGYAPPGINMKPGKILLGVGIGVSFVYSFSFVVRFVDSCNSLYEYRGLERVLIEGAKVETFSVLLGNGLAGFYVTALCMLVMSIYHYLYHFQETRSIYLMRRLPNRWELARRCLTLPVEAALLCIASAAVMLGLYYGIYVLFTPKGCLPM